VGLCFDFYRLVRWRLRLSKVLTFITDLLFSFASLLVIFYFAQKANFLELRFYLFGGCFLGLILYLRFISPASQSVFNIILSLIAGFKKIVYRGIRSFFHACFTILALFMSIPYGILRWFSLLIFRVGEALGKESATKVKTRITKFPRRK
jgi:spore cortex biosynthesis protein YabQ